MGKGGGCFNSKEQPEQATAAVSPQGDKFEDNKAQTQPTTAAPAKMTKKIYIVFYSLYGHVYKLAEAQKKGVESVEGVEAILYQVAETLPEGVLAKMHAPPKPDVPVLDVHDLPNADGILIGFPTRYGGMVAQMKAFWDATGGLWQKGALHGKPFSAFTSTASQGGGQETTIANSLSNFIHHGMIYVPPGYAFGGKLYGLDEVRGGSAWGAGTFAGGDGSRQPTTTELEFAEWQGQYFAKVVKKLAA